MMEPEFDLEDLECRLYSQVYHSNERNEEQLPICRNIITEVPTISGSQKKTTRYFQKIGPQSNPPSGSQTYITLAKNGEEGLVQETCTEIQNDITLDSNSSTVVTNCDTSQFHNNVTVNQFTVPVIIHPHAALPSQNQPYFKPWSKLTQYLLHPSKRQRKKPSKNRDKPKTEKISKWASRLRRKQLNEVTIFLSDDSNDDCVIVDNNVSNNKLDEMNTGFPKKYNESEGGKKPESDDDIIYIPPPPIEVIDIEENDIRSSSVISIEDKSSSSEDLRDMNLENLSKISKDPKGNEDLLESPESPASNDFLDNPPVENITTKFNFSLHGSDFNSTQGDFVRPSTKQPVEYCETESSCSTNELNRDFSNTVKTIVFDEVEFPKEDIFSDKNLDNFSSFITPKRSSRSSKEISISSSPKVNDKKVQDHDTSSDDTSSESDYDHLRRSHSSRNTENNSRYKNLPDLSLMVPVNETPRKSSANKKNAKHFLQCGSKMELRKKSENEDETESSPKKQTKRKKNMSPSVIVDFVNHQCHYSSDDGKKVERKKLDSASVSALSDIDEQSVIPEKRKKRRRKLMIREHPHSKSDTEVSYALAKLKKKNMKDTSIADESLVTEKENTQNSESVENKVNSAGGGALEVKISTSTIKGKEEFENTEITDVGDTNVGRDNMSEVVASERLKNKKRKSIDVLPDALGNEIDDVQEKLKKKKRQDSASEKLLLIDIEQSNAEEDARSSTLLAENCIDKSNESSSVVQASTETKKNSEVTQDFSKVESLRIEISSDDEITTDSDSDFLILDDTRTDIELANCVSPTQIVDTEKPDSSKNICVHESSHTIPTFEEFDVDNIQSKQSDNPDKWLISHRDRANYLYIDGNRGPRCNRCRHFGHTALKCTEKPEPPSCYLCGQQNHKETRCPNKRCTQCGNLGDYSTTYCWKCFKFRHIKCRLCKMKGHLESVCPDLWRRYHSTIDEGPIIVSRNQVKPRDKQWCSGCARQGHLEHECNYNREYPPTTPYVINYEDNLAQGKDRLPRFLVENRESPESTSIMSSGQPTAELTLPIPNHAQSINQLPEPNQFPIPNQLSLLNQLPAPHQIANLNHILSPIQIQIFSQLPLINQLQTLALVQNQNVVLNPCAISNSASSSSTVDLSNNDHQSHAKKVKVIGPKEIKEIILNMPAANVYDFLRKEMHELENGDIQPKVLKNKLFKYDKTTKPITARLQQEKAYWFRLLNMFIFGRHKIGYGQLHVNYLRKYLANSSSKQLDEPKRRSLLSSYMYIFNHEKQKSFNYYKWINIIIQKGTVNKYIS